MSTVLPLTGYLQVFREAPGVMREAFVKHKSTQNADTVWGKYLNIIKNACPTRFYRGQPRSQPDVEKKGLFCEFMLISVRPAL